MNICKQDFKPTEMVCIFGLGMLRPSKSRSWKNWYKVEMQDKSHPLIKHLKLLLTKNLKINFSIKENLKEREFS